MRHLSQRTKLLAATTAEGGTLPANQPEQTGTPPKAAEVAASGKSEREVKLERQNRAQATAITKLKEGKQKAEEAAAHNQREADRLKQLQTEAIAKSGHEQQQQQQHATEDSGWGFWL